MRAVRLDSGDLMACRSMSVAFWTMGACEDVTIFASGGLDEDELAEIMEANAPIDGFGVGTSLTTSSDVPALDCAYKLQEYAGIRGASDPPERLPGPGASRSGAALETTDGWPATCWRFMTIGMQANRC